MGSAMDALKYGSYMSGLYGSMSASSTTSTDPTNTTSNSTGSNGSKSPYLHQGPQQPPSELSPKSYDSSNNGSATSNNTALKSSYTADSLSRSYFDASRYDTKPYTPDSMNGGGRESADSPDVIKQQQQMQQNQQAMQHLSQPQDMNQQPQQQQQPPVQPHNMGFNSLQAYYSQHAGMGLGANGSMTGATAASGITAAGSMPHSAVGAGGTLPPFLPMAAQLSQYSAAASAAASAVAAAGSNYPQSAPGAPSGNEYRRPLSVLF